MGFFPDYTWEYCVIRHPDIFAQTKQLDDHGIIGWELVSTHVREGITFMYMKRCTGWRKQT